MSQFVRRTLEGIYLPRFSNDVVYRINDVVYRIKETEYLFTTTTPRLFTYEFNLHHQLDSP